MVGRTLTRARAMVETHLDALPVSALPDRYGVARSQVYNRIKVLGIETQKRVGKAYVDAAQLAQLDHIAQLIGAGKTLEEAAAIILQGEPFTQPHKTAQDSQLRSVCLPCRCRLHCPQRTPAPCCTCWGRWQRPPRRHRRRRWRGSSSYRRSRITTGDPVRVSWPTSWASAPSRASSLSATASASPAPGRMVNNRPGRWRSFNGRKWAATLTNSLGGSC
jgi:hypothetical protein